MPTDKHVSNGQSRQQLEVEQQMILLRNQNHSFAATYQSQQNKTTQFWVQNLSRYQHPRWVDETTKTTLRETQ